MAEAGPSARRPTLRLHQKLSATDPPRSLEWISTRQRQTLPIRAADRRPCSFTSHPSLQAGGHQVASQPSLAVRPGGHQTALRTSVFGSAFSAGPEPGGDGLAAQPDRSGQLGLLSFTGCRPERDEGAADGSAPRYHQWVSSRQGLPRMASFHGRTGRYFHAPSENITTMLPDSMRPATRSAA